jgi:hypothetical protein
LLDFARSRNGPDWIISKIVLELKFEKAPTAAAFQVSLASESIGLIQVRFIVDKLPRIAMSSRETIASFVSPQPGPQVIRIADIKTGIGFRSKHVNVEHALVLSALGT